jgi:hypothetical protein
VDNTIKDVHTEHCCILHGCKYRDEDCTVTTRKARQSYDCEECEGDQVEVTDEMITRAKKQYFETIKYWAPESLYNPEMVTDLMERVIDAALNPRWEDVV